MTRITKNKKQSESEPNICTHHTKTTTTTTTKAYNIHTHTSMHTHTHTHMTHLERPGTHDSLTPPTTSHPHTHQCPTPWLTACSRSLLTGKSQDILSLELLKSNNIMSVIERLLDHKSSASTGNRTLRNVIT